VGGASVTGRKSSRVQVALKGEDEGASVDEAVWVCSSESLKGSAAGEGDGRKEGGEGEESSSGVSMDRFAHARPKSAGVVLERYEDDALGALSPTPRGRRAARTGGQGGRRRLGDDDEALTGPPEQRPWTASGSLRSASRAHRGAERAQARPPSEPDAETPRWVRARQAKFAHEKAAREKEKVMKEKERGWSASGGHGSGSPSARRLQAPEEVGNFSQQFERLLQQRRAMEKSRQSARSLFGVSTLPSPRQRGRSRSVSPLSSPLPRAHLRSPPSSPSRRKTGGGGRWMVKASPRRVRI
jgi:hypothetical protein